MNDLISVIVPVYNVKNYLEKCLDSIINQTYKNLEIILINDGSTDGSLDICYMYEKKDNRIKVYNQENHGLSYTRNRGIELARGKYIGFVDSDDVISPFMYEFLYKAINEYNECEKTGEYPLLFGIRPEDIYDDETTFKADISIADFLNFIYSNESKVVSFVKSKKKINCASIWDI